MRAAEAECFEILERELERLKFSNTRLERHPINPEISASPHFSLLHFTKTASRPEGLTPEQTYAGRSNLLCFLPGAHRNDTGQSVALNAHLDVVAPYIAPRVKKGIVHGRGACDDKGPVVSIIAALKVLSELMPEAGLQWNRNVLAMFVVEEETGGNGSLSLAGDRELKAFYDSILVCECTGLKIHPANRGAVWFRAELNPPEGISAFELSAFVNEQLEKEGVAIRTESRHPLFPQRPVQTCHGIIGPFGEHPSRICGEVSFSIRFTRPVDPPTEQLVRDCLDAGLSSYVGIYGDKRKVWDPATGRPMVPEHFDLERTKWGFVVKVHGATGHMGAIRERDGAITKMAHLVRALIDSKARIGTLGGPVRFELGADPLSGVPAEGLVLEGGQGFVRTHTIEEVMERLRAAARRGVEAYLLRLGSSARAEAVLQMTYEKLHNVAFDGDPDSPAVRQAIAAAKVCGVWKDEPILGWTVSCDARLFASQYPGLPVLTFGPGQLIHAHSDSEQIKLEEIRAAAEVLAVFLLRQTGTVASLK